MKQRLLISSRVSTAVSAVREDVLNRANDRDIAYFVENEARFARAAQVVMDLLPQGGTVVDIGSHYLHQAAILARVGFRVIALDVPDHVRLDFVRARAAVFGVVNHEHEGAAVASGLLLPEHEGQVDAVLFCEILEHITFNPIRFWRRIYDLLKVGGFIYITTPNSVKLLAVLGAFWNLITLSRIGLRIDSIFAHVTYGHHWKEYSAREIRQYFSRMSPDFTVDVHALSLASPSQSVRELLGPFKTFLLHAGNATGALAEHLEAVVRLRARTRWDLEPPQYA